MHAAPPSEPLPDAFVFVVLYKGDSDEIHALQGCLSHIFREMSVRPQAVVCVRVGEPAVAGDSEYEEMILDYFGSMGGVAVMRTSAEHPGQGAMRAIDLFVGSQNMERHWFLFMHKPMKLHANLLGYTGAAFEMTAKERDMREVRLAKYCLPGSDHVVPNNNSVFDPNMYECFVAGGILVDLVDSSSGRYVAWCAQPGWNCSLMYYALGKDMFSGSGNVDLENAPFLLEIVWTFPALDYVCGCPVAPCLAEPYSRESEFAKNMEIFYEYDSDLKQLQAPVRREVAGLDESPALRKWGVAVVPEYRPRYDPDPERSQMCRESKGMAFGKKEALVPVVDLHRYTDEEASTILNRTASRVTSVLFVHMLGWTSRDKMWKMVTAQLASSPTVRPYINRFVLERVDEAARYCPHVRKSLAYMLALRDKETWGYLVEALADFHAGDTALLVRLLSIQKLELETIASRGLGQYIGSMQSFSILYYLYLSRKREARRKRQEEGCAVLESSM